MKDFYTIVVNKEREDNILIMIYNMRRKLVKSFVAKDFDEAGAFICDFLDELGEDLTQG